MPKNRLIYYGLILLIGTLGLWIGIELARRIIWLLPYLAIVAVVMIGAGAFYESRRGTKGSAEDLDSPAENPEADDVKRPAEDA
jgi:hypothetical protein